MTYIKLNDKDGGIGKIKENLAQNNEHLDGMMKKLKIARTTFEILSNRDRVQGENKYHSFQEYINDHQSFQFESGQAYDKHK